MIVLENISRVFKVGDQEVHALNDINLAIEAGDYISIMGPSGSGKSTLLNILGLLDRPDQGHYLLQDKDTTSLTDNEQAKMRCEYLGFVFQFFHLVSRLNAAENIELPMILAGIEPDERQNRIKRLLADYGLEDRANHRPDQLSGGQRQRVAIARATVMSPQVLFADEPTGNLDRASGMDVINILEQLNVQGITLIMVTHDPEIGHRARRQIHMVDGSITEDNHLNP
jgi:putative ABC transport system ATP-binding protein